jgi:DNA repair exonuclease SbcCD nuclease subunit
MSLRCFAISDIHFRDDYADGIYSELHEYFLSRLIDEAASVDLVILAGDTFHKRVQLDSKSAILALSFVREVASAAPGTPIRVLRGTIRHDFDMPRAFASLGIENLRVVETVSCEDFYGSEGEEYRVLFIPEEYPSDWREYYSEFLPEDEDGPFYNAIFGHGTVDFAAFSSQSIESERPIKSAPVFPRTLLDSAAPVSVFGHIHVAQSEGNVHYLGSFSRSAHGEEDPKGWGILELRDDGTYNLERVVNHGAPTFVKVKASSVVKGPSLDPEKIVDALRKKLRGGANVRLVLDGRFSGDDGWRAKATVIREALQGYPGFSMDASRASDAEIGAADETLEADDPVNEAIEQERPLEEVIAEFIRIESPDLEASPEEILKIISPPSERKISKIVERSKT